MPVVVISSVPALAPEVKDAIRAELSCEVLSGTLYIGEAAKSPGTMCRVWMVREDGGRSPQTKP